MMGKLRKNVEKIKNKTSLFIKKSLFIKNKIFLFKLKKMPLINSGISENVTGNQKIIVSLTSYPDRLDKIHLCIKSLLIQTVKPNMIILYLGNDTKDSDISPELRKLEAFGLTIKMNYENIKCHKKYYYAFKEYPNDIVITVDDDVIYDDDLIESLIESYKKHPKCVSAMRAHKITFNNFNEIMPYRKWQFKCTEYDNESLLYFATGNGGVLYPPHLLNDEWSNLNNIKKLCLNADDVWLKFMQILNNVPTVIVKSKRLEPMPIEFEQKSALKFENVSKNKNDEYISNLIKEYDIDISKIFK